MTREHSKRQLIMATIACAEVCLNSMTAQSAPGRMREESKSVMAVNIDLNTVAPHAGDLRFCAISGDCSVSVVGTVPVTVHGLGC